MEDAGLLKKHGDAVRTKEESPRSRVRFGHAALTIGEYFRDDEHRKVLLLVDNIFRFRKAGTEVSGLMGQVPSRLVYQPKMGAVKLLIGFATKLKNGLAHLLRHSEV